MAPIATIPSIPLSPVAKAWLVCRTNLEQADTALSKAKSQTHPAVSVSVLRKLMEDVKVERHRHDNLGRQMQSVQGATAFHWNPDVLAKQIAVIDCQLFGMVRLDKSSLCQTDLAQTHLDRMLDFHHYLTNNFAHQLIFWASLTKSTTTSTPDSVIPPVHPKDNMISHLVQVAHALLHTYRDLSGFAAIMKALMLPQVRRLRSLWKNCPSRIKEMYGEMAPILSPDHHYQAYHNVLCQKLSYFFFTATSPSSVTASTTLGTSTIDRMVVIPWMQPHLISLRSIVTDYAAISGDHATLQQTTNPSASNSRHTDSPSSNIELVLSAPGLQKLAVVMALLEQCQTCPASSSLATDFVSSSSSLDILEDYMRPWRQDGLHSSSLAMVDGIGLSSNGKRSRRQSMIQSANNKSGTNISSSSSSSIATISDLHTLFPGDLLVHHWLVSRVYLRKDQLVDESIQVQPLIDGEQLVCDTYSPDDAAIADLVAKKVSLSGALPLEQPSDGPSSPVTSAAFGGWKTATKSETVVPTSLNDSNNAVNSHDSKYSSSQQQTEKQHQSDDDTDDQSHDVNSTNEEHYRNGKDDKMPTTSQSLDSKISGDLSNVIQPPATTNEKDQPADNIEMNTTVDDKELTKINDTNLGDPAVDNTDTTKHTTEPLEDDNDNAKQLDMKKSGDDTAEHTLTTASTLASASASVSTSISSVSVIIEEEGEAQEKQQPSTTVADEKITKTTSAKKNQSPRLPPPPALDHSSSNSKLGKKSKLSPTAPEFVPLLAQPTVTYHHDNMPSSVAVTPSSSVHNGSIINETNEEVKRETNSSKLYNKRNGYIPITTTTTTTTNTTIMDGNHVLLSPQKTGMASSSSEDDDEWNGYPTPALEETQQHSRHGHQQQHHSSNNHQHIRHEDDDDDDEEADDDDEVWTGYPGPTPPPQRRGSLQSVMSDEWKGYHAAKMEARWELETALKVQQHEWQGYALETLNEEDPAGQ